MAQEEVEEKEPEISPEPEEAVVESEELVEDPVGKLQEEAKEFKEKYLRALAELENSRKRLSKEKIESQSFAIQNVVLDLLQPIDHFEQALSHAEHADATIAHWAKGFGMILYQLKQVLEDHGVTSFVSLGSQFDPHLHEAVETEESEEIAEGTITYEFHKGYQLGKRTIRAARVRVATRPKSGDTTNGDTNAEEIPEEEKENIEK